MMSSPDASPPPHNERRHTAIDDRLGVRSSVALEVVSVRGTQFGVSYSLPIAIAGATAIVMILNQQLGESDLFRVLIIGGLVWMVGCLLQSLAYLMIWNLWGTHCNQLTIGLLGVEFPAIHQTPQRVIALSLGTIVPVLFAAILCVAIGRWIVGETLTLTQIPWLIPSLGTTQADTLWHASAMLLGIQFLCQAFPLQRTAGRQILLGAIANAFHHRDFEFIVIVVRRLLTLMALITAMIAVAMLPQEMNMPFPRWPVLFFVSVVLWVSARNQDVPRALWAMVNVETNERGYQPTSWLGRIVHQVRMGARERRVLKTLEQERGEASDEARLDGILDRLHQHGESALTNDEKGVLRRVSERLRKTH